MKSTRLMMFAVLIMIAAILMLGTNQFGTKKEPYNGGAFGLDGEKIRAEGLKLYNEICMECHGIEGRGTSFGPPLVHVIYRPSHHSDQAFALATLQGVKAHHWDFGDMPPVPEVNQTQTAMITAYIRHLQRLAGIE